MRACLRAWVCACVRAACACVRTCVSVYRPLAHEKPGTGTKKRNDNDIINGERMQRTRTGLAVGSIKTGQTLTGVAVDPVHTGAAILTGNGGTLVDGWKERTVK